MISIKQSIPFLLLLILIGCKYRQDENAEGQIDSTKIAIDPSKDQLPSWNDGPLKDSIINYISRVTKRNSSDFIPPVDRIATFDNDGTLYAFAQPAVGNSASTAYARPESSGRGRDLCRGSCFLDCRPL